MPMASIVAVIASIRRRASSVVNGPVPRAMRNSVNRSASLSSSAVRSNRSVSIRNRVGK